MKSFEKFVKEILIHEGGYVNDPTDRGGETKYGIAKRSYPKLDIKNLTLSQASEIYYRDYWVKASCNHLPDHLQLIHFDSAVNHGVSRANKLLQKAIGDITVDGVIGRQTLSKV